MSHTWQKTGSPSTRLRVSRSRSLVDLGRYQSNLGCWDARMLECRGRSNVGVGICGAPARITLYTSANTAFLAKILGAGFLRASRELGCAAAKTLGIDLMMRQACRSLVFNASLLTQGLTVSSLADGYFPQLPGPSRPRRASLCQGLGLVEAVVNLKGSPVFVPAYYVQQCCCI